jgi:antitoxin ParD1/3/4
MAAMKISPPAAMKEWAEGQARSGRRGDDRDYVRDLIRRDQERSDKIAAMQRWIDEAEASGVTSESVPKILTEARRQARTHRSL